MDPYRRTDLACERMSFSKLPEGLCRAETLDGFEVERLDITDPAHATLLGKPLGQYITVHSGPLRSLTDEEFEALSKLLSRELRALCRKACGREIDKELSVLVVGLGNEDITPDAIGPRAVRQLTATRHLRKLEGDLYDAVGRCEISALFPGVLGQTGIETLESVRGAVENVKPHIVVAIDALAARSTARLAATLQLSDSGIAPGSGMGGDSASICRDSLGIPVIALGVPTVVESSTLVYEALERAGLCEGELDKRLFEVLEGERGYFVSPGESDLVTACVSRLLAESIDMAFTI